ncbi:MAG TPA: hypothetical protein VIZ58_12420 [Thermoanaerobaculia bacterium]
MTRGKAISIAAAVLALAAAPGVLFAHGHGHVQGTVVRIDAARIEVKTADGKPQQVVLTPKTKFVRGDAAATIGDVKPGERVVVHLGEDGSALEVHLPPASPAAPAPRR